MGLEVKPDVKDFLMGFPTLKHRNMGGFLLLSSDESSISTGSGMGKRALVYSHELATVLQPLIVYLL